MKPTIENLRKVAAVITDPRQLAFIKDHVAFYIAGAKRAAEALGRPMAEIEAILDEARAAEEWIAHRIRELEERPR